MIDHALLPSIRDATLPAAYERARAQLAECARVDECKDWADKARALASYARQADDDALEKHAVKIRARAIRRTGELLRKIEEKQGRTPGGTYVPSGQAKAAKAAGLSAHQRKTALRVANVPEEDFEAAVEAEKPARIPALAKKGTKSKPAPSAEFKAATVGQGGVRALSKIAAVTSAGTVVRGLREDELSPTLVMAKKARKWLDSLISQLERKLGK